MKSAALRQRFLDYFRRQGHTTVASSPLVPANDPTLLFTNAGMVQFKDVFLGRDQRHYKRAASSQRCVRAGGKHNDLENVGYTARHHTFFEMLGNFSFGDYFKREAIAYAWELITAELAIPRDRLWVTVYEDDDEAARIWREEVGVEAKRISRRGAKDNFWSMGDTGPCGPCTEIFYDHGPGVRGGPPGSPDEDGDRYVEIWNLVFMQYDRAADGKLTPLPKPSVDTGMGLERIAAVMQGVHSNYDIDLFQGLIAAAAELTGAEDRSSASLRVIADHIRACAFLIVDGVEPSNEGRGYVLRRIIRRAIRHGYKLGQDEPFFYKLVTPLDVEMGAAYPELPKKREHVERVLRKEEERFAETLKQGVVLFNEATATAEKTPQKVIPGEVAFKLYDTYGFPTDLTADMARERGLSVDIAGFEHAMTEQRERARAASKFAADHGSGVKIDQKTVFTGYDALADRGRVIALIKGEHRVDFLTPGEEGVVVLDRTPFYAEGGGQVGDAGVLRSPNLEFAVNDTQRYGKAHGHIGMHMGARELRVGDEVEAVVDAARRQATVLNHTATHLVHAALRAVLGEHVQQKGSLVAPDRLRFDFSHYEPMTPAQIGEVEALVNAEIRANADAEIAEMGYDEAIKAGALAFFGEKYDTRVRVLRLGDFSMELCGGTHVHRAGDIGVFKITSESGIAAGVRRIEAVTGQGALEYFARAESALQHIAGLVKANRDEVDDKVRALVDRSRALEKEIQQLKTKLAGNRGDELTAQAVDVQGVKVLAARIEHADAKLLRETVDRLKTKLGSAVIVLSVVEDGKIRLAAGVTPDRTDRLKAGEVISAVAEQVGGKGGGRPDFAQAGGTQPEKLEAALASVPAWVEARLASRAAT
jgi:alanyl-tRNA synthetase